MTATLVRGAPWDWCACGHPWLLHDVEDDEGTNPMCCADGCDKPCAEPSEKI